LRRSQIRYRKHNEQLPSEKADECLSSYCKSFHY
jgi:hypothetical protein